MAPKNSYRLLLLTLIGILMYSCQNEDDYVQEQTSDLTISEVIAKDSLPKIKLGKKLENPYSVTNMRLAYESLKKKIAIAAATSSQSIAARTTEQDIVIETTYYYVKF